MAFRTCLHCGTRNPPFLTRCVICGEPLFETTQKPIPALAYLPIGLVLALSFLAIGCAVIPAVHITYAFGQDFSKNAVVPFLAAPTRVPVYPQNMEASDGSLAVTVTAARDGQLSYPDTKFFLVTVELKNLRSDREIEVTGRNFELFDSKGTRYTPYGIESQVSYSLRPLSSTSVQLTYIITRDAAGDHIRFTFPAASAADNPGMVMLALS